MIIMIIIIIIIIICGSANARPAARGPSSRSRPGNTGKKWSTII